MTKKEKNKALTGKSGGKKQSALVKIGAVLPPDSRSQKGTVAIGEAETERKQAEKILRESELKFRNLFENSPLGKSMTGIDGSLQVNAAFCKLIGYSEKELQGKKWQDITHPDDVQQTTALSQSLLAGETNHARFEKRYIHRNGDIIWSDVSTYLQRDGKGQPQFFITTVNDITERKQAEEKLRALSARNEALLDTVPDIIMEVDNDKVYRWANRAGLEFFGDDVIGREAAFYMEGEQQIYQTVQPLFNGNEEIIYLQIWQRRRDGEKRLLAWWCRVLKDAEGNVTGALSSARDITEINQAEEALRASEEKLRSVLDSTPFPIAIVDLKDDQINYWSRSALDLFGHTAPTAAEWYQIAYPDPDYRRGVVERWKPFLEKAKQTHGTVNTGEYRISCRDGSVRICELFATFLPDNLIVTFNDITQRKQAELQREAALESLRESERRFRETVVTLDEGYYSVTLDGKLLDHNHAFCQILGFDSTRDLKGTHIPDFWQDGEDRETYVRELTAKGLVKGYLVKAKKTDGKNISVILNAHIAKDEKNQALHIEGTVLDISERIRAEEEIRHLNAELEQRVLRRTAQLETANKELEAFSYSVSHDLRAPLRAIAGFAQVLEEENAGQLDNEGRRLLQVIVSNTRKMGQLIDDLLALSRLGRQQIKAGAVDLAALASEVFSELKNQEKGRQLEFKVGKLPPAWGDRSLLRQVLQNLLANAVKFTRPKARAKIELGGRVEKSENVYFVRDNGVGFDMEYVHKLFGVFQRLHDSVEFEGTGVGLAIVQRIVQGHGGRAWAESKTGKGATFFFTIPAAPPAQEDVTTTPSGDES